MNLVPYRAGSTTSLTAIHPSEQSEDDRREAEDDQLGAI